MATQTPTRRQAAAKRAAATRKRNAATPSATTTKSSARRTRAGAASTRFGAFGRQAQRTLLIQVGAAATVGDKLRETARTYSTRRRVTRQLDRLERRGLRAINRGQRSLKRRRREFQHDVRGLV